MRAPMGVVEDCMVLHHTPNTALFHDLQGFPLISASNIDVALMCGCRKDVSQLGW